MMTERPHLPLYTVLMIGLFDHFVVQVVKYESSQYTQPYSTLIP